MARRFGRTTSTKSKGGAYGKGVGLGISVLLALVVISLAVWLLRRSARDENTPATPEPGEGVEAGVGEEAVVGEASTPGEAGEQKDKPQATPAAERKALVSGVDRAVAAGIPITVFDSGLDSQNYLSYVATDNVEAGRIAARTLGELLCLAFGGGRGLGLLVPLLSSFPGRAPLANHRRRLLLLLYPSF